MLKVKDGPLGTFGSALYRTIAPFSFQTKIYGHNFRSGKVVLYPDGELLVEPGFEFDGPSGPTHDDRQNLVPSLAHDALYLLGRTKKMPKGWRKKADKLLRVEMMKRIPANAPCWQKAALTMRSYAYYIGVRVLGGPFGSDRWSR
jgi:hypothetical protein